MPLGLMPLLLPSCFQGWQACLVQPVREPLQSEPRCLACAHQAQQAAEQ